MAALALAFDILAKDKTGRAFSTAGKNADGLSSKLSNVGKVATVALGGVAVAGVAAFSTALVGGIKSAVSYQTLQKKTEAVIKSTGNAAKISVKGIQGLASKLETVSGVDEELIINGQNVLATFTKIRNETGKGNKIFDRATESALNLSVALGTDLQSANTLVGKALNDPIKGLTALSRAGIQFTDDQKELIKTLVESGDVMGAQKIILGELETQFGGVAEAAGSGLAGDMARLKDAFDDAFRELGEAVLPTLTTAAQALADVLPGVIDKVKELANEALTALSNWWDSHGDAVIQFFEDIWVTLKDHVAPWVGNVAIAVGEHLVPALVGLGDWLLGDGKASDDVLRGIAAALFLYSAAAVAANWATIVLMGQFLLSAGIVLGLAYATDQLAERFKVDLAQAFQKFIDGPGGAVLRFFQRMWVGVLLLVQQIEDLIELIPGIPELPHFPGGGGGGIFGIPGVPIFADGGVMPGPRGVHSLAMVAGGETVLPTHKGAFDAVGEDQLLELRRQNGLLASIDNAVRTSSGIRGMRAGVAVMG